MFSKLPGTHVSILLRFDLDAVISVLKTGSLFKMKRSKLLFAIDA